MCEQDLKKKKRQNNNKKDNEMIVKDVFMHTVACTVQGSFLCAISGFFSLLFFKKMESVIASFTAADGHNADVNVQDGCMKTKE